MTKNRQLNSLFFILLIFSFNIFAENIILSDFEQHQLSQWEEHEFNNKTNYSLIKENSQTILKASSIASASGLVKKIKINLNKTPYLNWSWKIQNTLKNTSETQKTGDDYPARIYVVISKGIFFWKTRSLAYVWSSHQAVNSHWFNAYTSNLTMVAANSGKQKIGQWVQHKINLKEDIKRYLKIDADNIDAFAIMSDTDNTKQQATAYYKNIFFSNN
ncbi:MAG: DUF3047 domain-containing protein [Methylococcales bacterium]|jgi:hypothetical protein|nr:DUF3047 domain-containing protein [Methylococcales bacterium]MBT7410241.1 DUF3047 domain-containing protein [Methylococcales bacterium]